MMRVAELDMRDVTSLCPPGFFLNETAQGESGNSSLPLSILRTCTIISDDGSCLFLGVVKVQNVSFSAVCGRVLAYQYGSPDAFSDKWYHPRLR